MYAKIVKLLRSLHKKKEKPKQYTTDVQHFNTPEHVSISINKQAPFLVPHHVQVARGYLPQVASVHTGEGGLGRRVEHPAYIELQNFVPWSAIRHSVYGHAVWKINRTVHAFTCVIRLTTIVCDRQVMQAFRIYCIYYIY